MADQTATPVRSTAVVEDPTPAGGAGSKSAGGKGTAAKGAGGKQGAGGKKSGKRDGGSDGAGGPSLAGHPRAAHGVARTKAWGGLAGFALGGYLSLSTHTLADAGLRALAAGVVCYVAAWAIAVFVWRRLVVAELSHARQEALAAELAKLTSSSGEPPSSTG